MPSIVPGTAMQAGPLAVCVALQIAQLLVAATGFREVLRAALQRTIFLGKVWQQYVVQLLSFQGLYMLLFVMLHATNEVDSSRSGAGAKQTDEVFDWHSAFVTAGRDVSLFGSVRGTKDPRVVVGSNAGEVWCTLMYYSVVVQSCVGYGDMVPDSFILQWLSNVQMLLGVFYTIVIVSQVETLYDPSTTQEMSRLSLVERATPSLQRRLLLLSEQEHEQEAEQYARLGHSDGDRVGVGDDAERADGIGVGTGAESDKGEAQADGAAARVALVQSLRRTAQLSAWGRLSHNPNVRGVRRFIRRHLLLYTLAIQTLVLLLYYAYIPALFATTISSKERQGVDSPTLAAVCAVLQLLQMVAIVSTNLKYVHKMHSHEATFSFIAQSYIAVCLSFSGAYAALYVLTPNVNLGQHGDVAIPWAPVPAGSPNSQQLGWLGCTEGRANASAVRNATGCEFTSAAFVLSQRNRGRLSIWTIWARFLYFSVTTMTTAGFGDIYPTQWYSRLIVSLQILVSVLYSVVVLGIGLGELRPNVGGANVYKGVGSDGAQSNRRERADRIVRIER